MYDITALGELLIDFTPRGTSETGNMLFEANPGGAPTNVLAQAAKLGKATSFIGKVGADTFGVFLENTLKNSKIDTKGLVKSDTSFTTLAFVTLSPDGERSFSFARKDSADTKLCPEEVDAEQIIRSKILHIGTLSLTHESAREATVKALHIAKENGVLISVDPNLRLALWKNEKDAKNAMEFALGYADILKISDYEVEFLCGTKDLIAGAKALYKAYQPKILFVTCGKDGAFCIKDDIVAKHSGFAANVVDTTGAGDSFCGAALSKLIDLDLVFDKMGEKECIDVLQYANAAASVSTTKYGAISVMPTEMEFCELL